MTKLRVVILIFTLLFATLIFQRYRGDSREAEHPSLKAPAFAETDSDVKPTAETIAPSKMTPEVLETPRLRENPTPPSSQPPPPPGRQARPPQPPTAGQIFPTPAHAFTRPVKAPWIKYEKAVNHLRKDREIDDFARSVRTTNLAGYVIGSWPYLPPGPGPSNTSSQTNGSNQEPVGFDRLVGSYEGEIQFDDGKKNWQMSLKLSGKVEEQKLKGEAAVDISENGSAISKTTQKGDLTLLKKMADNSVGILVAPTDTHFFQLYYFPERDMLAGNYYEKKAPTQIVPLGTVRLTRKAANPRD